MLASIFGGERGCCSQTTEKSGDCAESANETLDQHEKSPNELSGIGYALTINATNVILCLIVAFDISLALTVRRFIW